MQSIGEAKKNKDISNMIISNNSDVWSRAAVYLAIQNYNAYCDQNGIQKALFLNVWVSEMFNASSTPLFKRLDYLRQQQQPINFF
mgnify:CR=1 FL=1